MGIHMIKCGWYLLIWNHSARAYLPNPNANAEFSIISFINVENPIKKYSKAQVY